VYIVDSYGQIVQKTFSFENQQIPPEPEIDYSIVFETLPVPKSVIEGETVEIRCQIRRVDHRNDTQYHIRYFQPDGAGELRLDDGTHLTPNDLFSLTADVFRLYYTSKCSEQQTIDVYIVDNAGRVVQKTFTFLNKSIPEDNESGEGNEDGGSSENDDSNDSAESNEGAENEE